MFLICFTNGHPLMKCLRFSVIFRSLATTSNKFGFTGFKISDKLHSRQVAQDFIFRLSGRERTILLEELQNFQAQAAAIRDVDKNPPPTTAQLRALAAHSAMPFIGFGFLDNLIMILAGDYIDTTLGITLGISTMAVSENKKVVSSSLHILMTSLSYSFLLNEMSYVLTVEEQTKNISVRRNKNKGIIHIPEPLRKIVYTEDSISIIFLIGSAAGMGNTLSDIAGIGSAWYVEKIATKVGVRAPTLTPVQIAMSRSRWTINLGRALGVTIGCILGMFPLIFRHNKDAEAEEEK